MQSTTSQEGHLLEETEDIAWKNSLFDNDLLLCIQEKENNLFEEEQFSVSSSSSSFASETTPPTKTTPATMVSNQLTNTERSSKSLP